MTSLVASSSALDQLYASLCASGTQSLVVKYLNTLDATTYTAMANALYAWRNSSPEIILNKNFNQIAGLRIQVVESDGKVAFDSGSGILNNQHHLINIPKPDFLTTGKFSINENHSSRTYVMAALLNESGIARQEKWSSSVKANQMYLGVRQGATSNFPEGVVVVSINV